MLVQLITLEKTEWQGKSDSVSVPTANGLIEVLPHHVNLVAVVVAGEVIIKTGGETISFFVSEGSVQIKDDEVTILADLATKAMDLTEARIEEAKKVAQQAKEEKVDDLDFAMAEANLKRELAKEKIIQKYHKVNTKI